MSIHPLGRLDVVACEGDDKPSASHAGAPLLEAEAAHAETNLLGREARVHIHTYEFRNACRAHREKD